MGWFSDIFSIETLAPIAAGALTGGAGYGLLAASAAGAGTGAGIAALKGDDILAGAVGGGLSGMTGGSLSSAFNPASTSGQIAQTGGRSGINTTASTYNPVLASGKNVMQPAFNQAGREAIAGASGFGNTASALGTGFKQGVQNLGGGSSLVGAGKLASTGLGLAGIAGLDQTPMTMEEDDRGKYDPNATLDLSGDSGLRLIASGGYIGKRNYADGGYLEGGPAEGDGMSDDIPATIDETQPAALSEGEFVIPADVVAFAGNGSSDAGARRFYEMMEQIRRDATGRAEQIREIDVEDYMPYSSESRSF